MRRRHRKEAAPPIPGERAARARVRRISYTRLLGLLFNVAGFVVIGLGWNGMARVACPDCQLPYLLSAGATGLGLIVFGVGLLVIAQMRADRLRSEVQLEELTAAITRAARTTAQGGEPGAAGNGRGRVVAGTATYHRPDCRLVQGKPDLDYLSVEDARTSGLAPCRVCAPTEPDLGAAAEAAPGSRGPADEDRSAG